MEIQEIQERMNEVHIQLNHLPWDAEAFQAEHDRLIAELEQLEKAEDRELEELYEAMEG